MGAPTVETVDPRLSPSGSAVIYIKAPWRVMQAEAKVEAVRTVFDQPEWYFKKRAHDIQIRVETVNEFSKLRPAARILDIGCGDGSISRPLLKANTQLTCIDVANNMLSIAKAKVPPEFAGNVVTINEDFMNAEFEPQSFDLILCIGLMVHVVSPAAFIAKVVTLLKPGGSIIMECSDASHFTFKLLYPIYRFKALFRPSTYSLNAVTYAEISKILTRHKLVEEATFRYSAPAPLIDRVVSQRTLYKLNRLVYGHVGKSRNAWLGNECLSLFSKPV